MANTKYVLSDSFCKRIAQEISGLSEFGYETVIRMLRAENVYDAARAYGDLFDWCITNEYLGIARRLGIEASREAARLRSVMYDLNLAQIRYRDEIELRWPDNDNESEN